jgi:hypothetical protein
MLAVEEIRALGEAHPEFEPVSSQLCLEETEQIVNIIPDNQSS